MILKIILIKNVIIKYHIAYIVLIVIIAIVAIMVFILLKTALVNMIIKNVIQTQIFQINFHFILKIIPIGLYVHLKLKVVNPAIQLEVYVNRVKLDINGIKENIVHYKINIIIVIVI